MKPMGSKKSEILKSLNKNPQIAPKKETEFTDYYDWMFFVWSSS